MRKTVLGTIIEENNKTLQDQQRLVVLQQRMGQEKDVDVLKKLQAEASSIQQKLKLNDKKRSDIIVKIEAITGRSLITYFTLNGSLNDRDSRIIEDFLLSRGIKQFDIIVDSPGGQTDASEKIIKICRERTKNGENFDFRVIVVGRAKSAATLFALGSSKILLCRTAELGPVDPQIAVFTPAGEMIRDSAHQIYFASQEYLKSARALEKNDGDLLMLSKYDPIAVERARVAISHTEDIIAKRIYTNPYLIYGYKSETEVKKELEVFTDHRKKSYSHGRPIYFGNIQSLKFCKNQFIQQLDDYYLNNEKKEKKLIDKLEQLLWELYVRSIEVVRNDKEPIFDNNKNIVGFQKVAIKLFESSNGLILTKETAS